MWRISSSLKKKEPSNFQKKKIEAEEEARTFFEVSSHPLPSKKLVSNKTGKAACVLNKPLTDVYADYKEAVDNPVSFSYFASCRPKHVCLQRQAILRQCLCEYCTNVELKLRAVNEVAARIDNRCRIRHVYHVVDIITCGRSQGSWKKECAYGNCLQCSSQDLTNHLDPLTQHQAPVMWNKWESQAYVNNGKRVKKFY